MYKTHVFAILILLMFLWESCTKPRKHFEATVESLQQYETPEWFRDAKFGIWNVWGPYSVPAVGEWYARNLYIMEHEKQWQVQGPYHRKVWGHQSEIGYKDYIPMWKAENFDALKLMKQYKKAGAKYYSSIATFHDNFDLFNSKHTRWNSVNMGPKKDMVKAFQDAAHACDLRYGTTTHLARSLYWWQVNKGTPDEPYDGVNPELYDLYHPPYDPDNPNDKHIEDAWADMWNKRIKDLIENYELDLLYFDGAIPFEDKGYDVVANFYNNNLKRHKGKENGVMCIKGWPTVNGKEVSEVALMDYERKKSATLKEHAWQTDDHMGCWGYNQFAQYRSTNYIVDKLIDIVSKNGNLLLCLPLKADGTHPSQIDTFLVEMGEWMDMNGEAIYETRPWKIFGEGPVRREAKDHSDMESEETMDERDIRFTQSKDHNTLFVSVLGKPSEKLMIKSLSSNSEYLNKKIKDVALLGTSQKINWNQTSEGLYLSFPKNAKGKHAWCYKLELTDED